MFITLTSAFATTLIPMDFQDLTAKAELIFVGTVIDIRSEKAANTIYTHVTFADLRVLKGSDPGATIEVRLSGGTVAGETVHVFGMPEFVVGEKNIIFLAGNSQFICPIVGSGQGRFKVRWDEISRQEVIFDDRDVPVTEIRGREIVRAKRTQNPKGSPGVPDRGVVAIREVQKQEFETKVPLEGFVSAIETRMGIGSQLPGSEKVGVR
jgi:hypothetical protein